LNLSGGVSRLGPGHWTRLRLTTWPWVASHDVLDPASIQVNRRARRVKTDRIDVLALLRALIATDRGERHVCAVDRASGHRSRTQGPDI
jgi:hypothetical protein